MNVKIFVKQVFSFLLIVSFFIAFSSISHAAPQTLVQSGDCTAHGTCQISDLMEIVVRVTTIILGLTGTVVLVAFVYAGFLFLISAGSSEKITQAKTIIKGAVIGMLVVFLSFTIITFVFKALGVTDKSWWESTWFN